MESQGAAGSQDPKKSRSNAQDAPSQEEASSGEVKMPHRANGPVNPATNGTLVNGVSPPGARVPTTNGQLTGEGHTTAETSQDAPPQLDQSWRESPDNKPLGLMLERAAQQCYFDLNETLRKMRELGADFQPQQSNGVVAAGTDTSKKSLEKKRLLMEFAKIQRTRFVQSLVLSDWSRNGEELAKLIDIKVWQAMQLDSQRYAAEEIGRIKLDMMGVKLPPPNLRGAMEILGTGKAPWMPDFNFIPPKPLTAKAALKTLRNMNVMLSERLNLHEELPPYFQDFAIANGRATFTVPEEFEVDLSIADEDVTKQFFFIDIRFLFTPASDSLDENLVQRIESKANFDLESKGLKGCYDLLHNFVLTHKITLLGAQARKMIQGKWFDCLTQEVMSRRLIVQYWAEGEISKKPKNWVEVGISSGKAKYPTHRRLATPHLSVRWFRRGVEIKDEGLQFDWKDLDFVKSLSMVIAKDTTRTLKELLSRILDLAPKDSLMTTKLATSDTAAEDCALTLSLPALKQPVTVRIEPVTGQFFITPPSAITTAAAADLNTNVRIDPARRIIALLCSLVKGMAQRQSSLLGWLKTPNMARQNNLDQVFGEEVRQISAFSPSSAWGSDLALGVTFTLAGERWWTLSLQPYQDQQGRNVGRIISAASLIELQQPIEMSRDAFRRIERLAVSKVTFGALIKELELENVPNSLQKVRDTASGDEPSPGVDEASMALYIRFAPLVTEQQGESRRSWAADPVRLTYHGFGKDVTPSGALGQLRHNLQLRIEPGKMKELKKHLSQFRNPDLTFTASDGLICRFLTPFGQPFLHQIRALLHGIERLDSNLATIKDHRFKLTHASLDRLDFTYHNTPPLSAHITFPANPETHTTLTLEPHETNPHTRIRQLLEQPLNTTTHDPLTTDPTTHPPTPFATLATLLPATLPLLTALTTLPNPQTFTHHPTTATAHTLTYHPPLPPCTLHLKLLPRREASTRQLRWQIQDAHERDADIWADAGRLADSVHAALRAEVWESRGEGWFGVGNGVVAETRGVGEVVRRVDGVLRVFEGRVPEGFMGGKGGGGGGGEGGGDGAGAGGGADGAEKVKGASAGGDAKKPASEQDKGKDGEKSAPAAKGGANANANANANAPPVKKDPDVIMLD